MDEKTLIHRAKTGMDLGMGIFKFVVTVEKWKGTCYGFLSSDMDQQTKEIKNCRTNIEWRCPVMSP